MNVNRSLEPKNWNSSQGQRSSTIQVIKTDPYNTSIAKGVQEIDENTEDVQVIEKNLLTLNLTKQEVFIQTFISIKRFNRWRQN